MNIDPGLAVVIIAALIFYLRLIILQRERARRQVQLDKAARAGVKKAASQKRAHQSATGDRQGKDAPSDFLRRYSSLSREPRDWIIAATGALAILVGALLYAGVIPVAAARPYWWIPMAAGIVAFSWAFKV